MRRRRSAPHSCLGQFFRKEFSRRDAKDFGQTLDRTGTHVLRTPFDALIPFQICAEQTGDLLLCQAVPFAQFAQPPRDEFE